MARRSRVVRGSCESSGGECRRSRARPYSPPMDRRRTLALIAVAMLARLAAPATAQDAPPPPPQPAPQQPPAQPIRFADLPPPLRLGVRVEDLRRKTPVIPVVVLVSDGASYTEAIARWTPAARYPVLWDNGTPSAREDIARFVRAFAPAKVIRYSAAAEETFRRDRGLEHAAMNWPETAHDRAGVLDEAFARAWGAAKHAEFPTKLKAHGLLPPGVIVSNPDDPAWPAALALAAGRAQPVHWIAVPGRLDDEMPLADAESLAAEIESGCDASRLAWRDTGDVLDAVTICLNAPVKVKVGPDKFVALTDFIGRRPVDGAASRETGVRWAWAGQVHGSEPQAAYRAMAALFLAPRRAWLFDGYPDSPPWSNFDATKAGAALRRAGLEVSIDDTPRQGRDDWLRRASNPLDAGLVLLNTKGNADFFELEPGMGRPGDAPILAVPAIVHMVHSWSAAWPGDRETVAGRWFERGAYAYAGSVQEPFLQAFVPTPVLAARITAHFPWGAAARLDAGPAWRIAVFGDPLITWGPDAPRVEGEPPLDGTHDAADAVPAAVQEKRWADALAALTILGRDDDAAKLAAALMKDDPKAVTPEVVRAAIMPLFRTGRIDDLVEAFGSLGPEEDSDPWLRDALWLAGAPRLAGTPDQKLLGALRTHLRRDQPGRDAATLAPFVASLYGRDSAASMLREARAKSARAPDLQALDEAERRLRGR